MWDDCHMAQAYDWSSHETRRRPRVEDVHGHEVLLGDEDYFQVVGARLISPPLGPGWTLESTCGVKFCLTHTRPRPPIRPAYPPGVCVYCGFPGDSEDHVMPRAWTGDAARKRTVTVPSCRECNSIIGSTYAPHIAERRRIAHAGLRRKYRKYLRAIMWGPSDLAEMGPSLRSLAEEHMRKHTALMGRLKWPEDPLYDARALADVPDI